MYLLQVLKMENGNLTTKYGEQSELKRNLELRLKASEEERKYETT